MRLSGSGAEAEQQTITIDQIKVNLDAFFRKCPEKGGSMKFSDNPKLLLKIRNRSPPGSAFEAYNPDFELEKPYCSQSPEAPSIGDNNNCIKAVESLQTDAQGRIKARGNGVITALKSCGVSQKHKRNRNVQMIRQTNGTNDNS
ncbi:hypothetical protein PtB15_17B191 [Puccinia triticina]|nr:hypothetical protein PtB15_17B191 [Puccinia triticina]